MACEMSANDPIRTSATLDFCNGRPLGIGVHLDVDFGHAFLRAGLVPIAARRSADAQPSYDLVAALDRDPPGRAIISGRLKSAELAPAGFLLTVSAKELVRSKPKQRKRSAS